MVRRADLALAMLMGLAFAPPVLAQRNLPSDVEERMGIAPNAANRDGGRATATLPPIGSNGVGSLPL